MVSDDKQASELEATQEELREVKLELGSAQEELEEAKKQLQNFETEREATQEQLRDVNAKLEEAKDRLKETPQCDLQKGKLTKWDIMYSCDYYNKVFTKALKRKLKSQWKSKKCKIYCF